MSAKPRAVATSDFEELAGRHRPGLVAFAATIAPPSRADDVVQDALLRAYLALERGDRPASPKAWLYAIVRNTALNHRRAWRQHDRLDETIDGVEQPFEATERRRRFGRLVDGLRRLPARQRDAIVQRELEGRGHEEIAGSLGVTPAAVRQLIFRARASLRAGAGALVPTGVLRLLATPGAAETGAGAGLGPTIAKLGAGAALATGVALGGAGLDLAERVAGEAAGSGPAALAPEDASAAAAPSPPPPPAGDGTGRAAARGREGGGDPGKRRNDAAAGAPARGGDPGGAARRAPARDQRQAAKRPGEPAQRPAGHAPGSVSGGDRGGGGGGGEHRYGATVGPGASGPDASDGYAGQTAHPDGRATS